MAALVVLVADALLPRERQGLTAWIALGGLAATAAAVVPLAGAARDRGAAA